MNAFFLTVATVFTLIVINNSAHSQTHEVGISAGALNYTGDLAPDYSFYNYGQSLMGFYKYNFSPAGGVKLSILEGQFIVNDKRSNDPLPQYRMAESNTMIVEFSAIGEYNFFDYRKENDRRRFTPYLSGGVAFFVYSQNSPGFRQQKSDGTGFAIPFGVGVRYQVARQVNLGLEFVARKTFSDNLDGLSDRVVSNRKQVGDPHGNDWYYFTGLTLSYTFYGVKCPAIFR